MTFNTIKTLALGWALATSFALPALASGGGVAWDKAPNKMSDMAALQDGARTFVTYCLNCHGAEYMRYGRMQDIGFTPDQIKNELVLTGVKVGDTMRSAITAKEGKAWFGNPPPDLSVIARSRAGANGTGTDYIYTYLRGYYRDDASPTGFNNTVYINSGMPHVFWELQGDRKAVFEEHEVDGHKTTQLVRTEQLSPGSLSEEQFNEKVANLANFLQWMGEPVQGQRKTMGIYVLIFLAGFIVVAYRLNKAYWKDIK